MTDAQPDADQDDVTTTQATEAGESQDSKDSEGTEGAGVPALPDTQSDPALGEGDRSDWSSEGGAAAEGPATDVDDE